MPANKPAEKRTYQEKLKVHPMTFEEAVARVLKAGPMPKNGKEKIVRKADKPMGTLRGFNGCFGELLEYVARRFLFLFRSVVSRAQSVFNRTKLACCRVEKQGKTLSQMFIMVGGFAQ